MDRFIDFWLHTYVPAWSAPAFAVAAMCVSSFLQGLGVGRAKRKR